VVHYFYADESWSSLKFCKFLPNSIYRRYRKWVSSPMGPCVCVCIWRRYMHVHLCK